MYFYPINTILYRVKAVTDIRFNDKRGPKKSKHALQNTGLIFHISSIFHDCVYAIQFICLFFFH
jgi:hypothetical protein